MREAERTEDERATFAITGKPLTAFPHPEANRRISEIRHMKALCSLH